MFRIVSCFSFVLSQIYLILTNFKENMLTIISNRCVIKIYFMVCNFNESCLMLQSGTFPGPKSAWCRSIEKERLQSCPQEFRLWPIMHVLLGRSNRCFHAWRLAKSMRQSGLISNNPQRSHIPCIVKDHIFFKQQYIQLVQVQPE